MTRMTDTSSTHPTASTSHHRYQQVITYINKSWHIRASHNALERVMTHMNDTSPTHPTASTPHIYAHQWIVSVFVNESCHTYEKVTLHIWMSHVTHMNMACHTWMSHVTHMNEACHTYKWVMSPQWIRHDTYERVMTRMNGISHTHPTAYDSLSLLSLSLSLSLFLTYTHIHTLSLSLSPSLSLSLFVYVSLSLSLSPSFSLSLSLSRWSMNEWWHAWKTHLTHIQLLTDHASAQTSRLVYESNGFY